MKLNQRRFPIVWSRQSLTLALTSCALLASALMADQNVSKIVTLAAEPSYSHRYRLLHQLPDAALDGQAEDLIAFMRAQRVPAGMNEAEYMSLVNDIYNLLLKNGTQVQRLFEICLEVIPDQEAGRIWRDYCMQKLGYTLDRDDIAPANIHSALQILDAATQGAYPRMQGTAFIVAYMHKDLSFDPQPGFLDVKILGSRALSAAKDESIPLIDRITALQTAAKCRYPGTLEYAASLIAEREQGEPMLKVVAIACIGQLGSPAQQPLLDEYRLSADIRLRSAARTALRKIKEQS